jgi:hypothetical protein
MRSVLIPKRVSEDDFVLLGELLKLVGVTRDLLAVILSYSPALDWSQFLTGGGSVKTKSNHCLVTATIYIGARPKPLLTTKHVLILSR